MGGSLPSYVHLFFPAPPALTSISFQAGLYLFSAVLTVFVVPEIQDFESSLGGRPDLVWFQNPRCPTQPFIHRRLTADHMQSVCRPPRELVRQRARAYMRIFQQSRNPLMTARIRLFLSDGVQRLPSVAGSVPGLTHIFLIRFL